MEVGSGAVAEGREVAEGARAIPERAFPSKALPNRYASA